MTTCFHKLRAGCWACGISIIHPFVAYVPTDELPDTKQKETEERTPQPRQKTQEIGRASTDRIDIDRTNADRNDADTDTYLNIAIDIDIDAAFAVDVTERQGRRRCPEEGRPTIRTHECRSAVVPYIEKGVHGRGMG
jgi:predicted RNA-binding Zn-ribbon protein involved in translation (DUF1610 family)